MFRLNLQLKLTGNFVTKSSGVQRSKIFLIASADHYILDLKIWNSRTYKIAKFIHQFLNTASYWCHHKFENTFFRWGTHLYMSLFPSVCPSVCLSVCRAAYFRNRTLSDHNFWYTYVKWWCIQVFFSFFQNFDFMGCYGD